MFNRRWLCVAAICLSMIAVPVDRTGNSPEAQAAVGKRAPTRGLGGAGSMGNMMRPPTRKGLKTQGQAPRRGTKAGGKAGGRR